MRLASGMSPWNEIIIVFPSRGFISGSLSFERHVRTVCSRHVVPSKFHVSSIVTPLLPLPPPRDIAADASTIEINGAEIELEARVNEYYTAKRRALIRCGHDRNAKWQSKTN